MKAILNVTELSHLLSQQDINWQRAVYDRTGVIPAVQNGGMVLFSNCGKIDLDCDAEYHWRSGKDLTAYYEVRSINDLIKYILQMESYRDCLLDTSFGTFSKADLFWAVCSTIIDPSENQLHKDGTYHPDWEFLSIRSRHDHLELSMAVIDCDQADIWISRDEDRSLHEILALISNEMNKRTEGIDDIPQQRVFIEYLLQKPTTYDALMDSFGLTHAHEVSS